MAPVTKDQVSGMVREQVSGGVWVGCDPDGRASYEEPINNDQVGVLFQGLEWGGSIRDKGPIRRAP